MPAFAGFDVSGYPGDAAMSWLKANTNLVWCGYYLAAPSHPHSTWLGKRAQLSAAGWGIAPVFVGQQVIPRAVRILPPPQALPMAIKPSPR